MYFWTFLGRETCWRSIGDLRCGLGVAGRVSEDRRCPDWSWHLLPLPPLPAHKCPSIPCMKVFNRVFANKFITFFSCFISLCQDRKLYISRTPCRLPMYEIEAIIFCVWMLHYCTGGYMWNSVFKVPLNSIVSDWFTAENVFLSMIWKTHYITSQFYITLTLSLTLSHVVNQHMLSSSDQSRRASTLQKLQFKGHTTSGMECVNLKQRKFLLASHCLAFFFVSLYVSAFPLFLSVKACSGLKVMQLVKGWYRTLVWL